MYYFVFTVSFFWLKIFSFCSCILLTYITLCVIHISDIGGSWINANADALFVLLHAIQYRLILCVSSFRVFPLLIFPYYVFQSNWSANVYAGSVLNADWHAVNIRFNIFPKSIVTDVIYFVFGNFQHFIQNKCYFSSCLLLFRLLISISFLFFFPFQTFICCFYLFFFSISYFIISIINIIIITTITLTEHHHVFIIYYVCSTMKPVRLNVTQTSNITKNKTKKSRNENI